VKLVNRQAIDLYKTRLSFNRIQTTHEQIHTLFAPVTLTLTRWPLCMNLTQIVWRCSCVPTMNFVGERLQKLEHYR